MLVLLNQPDQRVMDLYLDQQLEVMQSGLPLMDLDHKLPLVARPKILWHRCSPTI